MNMLEYIESALNEGIVSAQMTTGRYWKIRRNGKTQTWITRPGEFRIPIKAGLRTCGELTHTSRIGLPDDGSGPDFIVNRIAGGQRFNYEGPK